LPRGVKFPPSKNGGPIEAGGEISGGDGGPGFPPSKNGGPIEASSVECRFHCGQNVSAVKKRRPH